MHIPKVYGEGRNDACFFCAKSALMENQQGLPVCSEHKESIADGARCACGELTEVKKSKWGAFFLCPSCGPISLSKMKNLTNGFGEAGYKLNKKYRGEMPEKIKKEATIEKKQAYDMNKIYSMDELVEMWDKK